MMLLLFINVIANSYGWEIITSIWWSAINVGTLLTFCFCWLVTQPDPTLPRATVVFRRGSFAAAGMVIDLARG